jgi:IstB-like ATP binding protein
VDQLSPEPNPHRRTGGGKTHLTSAIGMALVENGWRVLFARTSDLVQKLQVARRELGLESAINLLDRFHLLILDDLTYVSKDQAEISVLFELISTRSTKGEDESRTRRITTHCQGRSSEWCGAVRNTELADAQSSTPDLCFTPVSLRALVEMINEYRCRLERGGGDANASPTPSSVDIVPARDAPTGRKALYRTAQASAVLVRSGKVRRGRR